jgi:hypothetical protein
MAKYEVLSGECYTVEAESEQDALDKFFAYNDGADCPCDAKHCTCVEWSETLTEVV